MRQALTCLCLLVFMWSQAQDEEYGNARISNAFEQHDNVYCASYATDGKQRFRLDGEYGVFYYDNFVAGPRGFILGNENEGLGFGFGYFARDYLLNGSIRLFVQAELNAVIQSSEKVRKFEDINSDFGFEYGLQSGLAFPIDINGDVLSLELLMRYYSLFGDSEPSFHGFIPGVRLTFMF